MCVYLKEYESVQEAREEIGKFINMYNSIRPHASLNGGVPDLSYNTYYALEKVS